MKLWIFDFEISRQLGDFDEEKLYKSSTNFHIFETLKILKNHEKFVITVFLKKLTIFPLKFHNF